MQRESRAREAEAREKAARLQEAQGIIRCVNGRNRQSCQHKQMFLLRRMELELQTRPDLIHVQNSTDIYSIYESVDEISANVSSLSASSAETQQQHLQQVSAVDLHVKSKTRQQQRQQQQHRRRRRQIEQEKQRRQVRRKRNFE